MANLELYICFKFGLTGKVFANLDICFIGICVQMLRKCKLYAANLLGVCVRCKYLTFSQICSNLLHRKDSSLTTTANASKHVAKPIICAIV